MSTYDADDGRERNDSTETTANRQATASGLEPNVAGAAAYALGWLTGLFFFFTEKEDEFVRFHAAQSIVAFGALTVISFLLQYVLVGMVFTTFSFGLWQIVSMISSLFMLGVFALWIGMMYMAYQGRWYELPIAAGIANNMIADDGQRTVERKPVQQR